MYSRRNVFVAACMGIFIFGIVMAVLGAVLPSVIEKFGLDNSHAGGLFLLLTFGMLVGSILFGPVVDRYGYKGLMVFCTALVMAGFWGISLSPDVMFLQLSLFVIGLGGGVINGGANALVSDISEGSRGSGLSFLGFYFGIGAFGLPFLLGTLLDTFPYESIIAAVGTFFLIPLVFFLFLNFPAPKQAQGFPLEEALGLVREGPLLLFGLTLFVQSGLEMTAGGWTAAYLNEVLEVGAQRAVLLLSAYWLGLMTARLAGGVLLKRISGVRILQGSVVVSLAGSACLLLAEGPVPAVAGLFLMGVGFASVFPVVLGFVGDAYAHLSGTAFSLVLTMGLSGGMLFPWLIGMIADALTLRQALLFFPAALVTLILVFRIALARSE